jgi:hypothetical protein
MTNTETKLADLVREVRQYYEGGNAPMELQHRIELALDAIDAAHDTASAQPASAPGGWVVVPSAPTSAMVEACVKLKLDRLKGFMEGDYEPKDVRQSTVEDWLAMLAAAPQPAKESE